MPKRAKAKNPPSQAAASARLSQGLFLASPRCSAILFLLWALLGLTYFWLGLYIGDEGWYCLVSREVWTGRTLYSDIPFTQMPLLPYLYGIFLKALPARIESGRIISLLLATSGIWAMWKLCRERYGLLPANSILLFLVFNRTFAFDVTNVKTQSLAFTLCCWSLLFLHRTITSAARPMLSATAAGAFAGLALASRLSLLPFAVLLPPALYFATRDARTTIAAALGAWLLPVLICAPFLMASSSEFLFGVFGFHEEFTTNQPLWIRLRDYWVNVLQNYPALVAASIAAIIILAKRTSSENVFEQFVLLAWGLIALLQCTRQTTYAVYQTTITWGSLIALAYILQPGMLPRVITPIRAITAGLLLTAIMSPWAEGWISSDPTRNPRGILQLGRKIATLPGQKLFTLDAGFAFTAPEKQLLPGYEMSEFSIYWMAHELQDPQGKGPMKAIQQILDDLATKAEIAVLRSTDLNLLKEPVKKVLLELWGNEYTTVEKLNYGQFGHTLLLGVRNPR